MACYRPLHGHRTAGGRVSFTRSQDAYVDRPVTVSCGQCIGCRLERSRQWAVRIMHEASLYEANSFLTLTYSDDNLPPNRSLVKDDWQLFAKRLRQHLKRKPSEFFEQAPSDLPRFRFYQCGEYGERTGRPHHHACVFGLDFSGDRTLHKRTRSGDPLYTSELLDTLWDKGHCLIGDLTFESAAYVARYVCKKVTGKEAPQHYESVDLTTGEVVQLKPEFATMSRRPGIGKGWIEKWVEDVYPRDHVTSRGRLAKPPKFYDAHLGEHDPQMLADVKRARQIAAAVHEHDQEWERLAVREIVQEDRNEKFGRGDAE